MLSVMLVHILVYKSSIKKRYTETVCRSSIQKQHIEKAYRNSTLVIRGMAVGDILPKDFLKVFWKELRVSMLVGAVLSAVNFIRLAITYPGNEMVAFTVDRKSVV